MANNLAAAVEALRQKGPKKKYLVEFVSNEYYSTEVDAVDEKEASQIANEQMNNGELSGNRNNIDEITCKEI